MSAIILQLDYLMMQSTNALLVVFVIPLLEHLEALVHQQVELGHRDVHESARPEHLQQLCLQVAGNRLHQADCSLQWVLRVPEFAIFKKIISSLLFGRCNI